MEKLRQKIQQFVLSPKDVPLLAGFVTGLYMLVYYYSKNFGLANSWEQFGFFVAYFMLLPMAVLFAGYKVAGAIKQGRFKRHFLFVGIPAFVAYYLIRLSLLGENKRYVFAAVLLVLLLLSIRLGRYYKVFVLALPFMMLFNARPFLPLVKAIVTQDASWEKQPDGILQAKFKNRPNIYYIQPDGYTSFANLRDSNYNFNDSAFEAYLRQNGFTLYDNYRSNYNSTITSNTSMFYMKHHYLQRYVGAYAARQLILGNNPVLQVLKHNGYTTHFITEKPYLLMNRPKLGYDYCNFSLDDIPYLKDGWDDNRDIGSDFKKVMKPGGGNFYFLEKILPGHINVYKARSRGIEEERKDYLRLLEQSNVWLTETIDYIKKADPNGIIVIAADHGGFVGYSYTFETEFKTGPLLTKGVFGAMCAIKWNNPAFNEYDKGLETSVNLFRTVFSFLSEDKKYLQHLQEDGSYMLMADPQGLHRLIDANGNVVKQKTD